MKAVILIFGIIIFAVMLLMVIGLFPWMKSSVDVANETNADLAGNFTGFNMAVKSYLWLPLVLFCGWGIFALWNHLRSK